MASLHLGQPRTYYAGNVYVNRGKFRGLSEADETLMEVITNPGRKHEVEIPDEDIQLLNYKHESGMYSHVGYEGKAANYGSGLPGQGAEFTPVSVAGQIIDQVNLLSKVRGHHQLFNATSDPFKIPLNKSTITVKFIPPGQTDGAASEVSGTDTGDLEIQHAKLIAATTVSTEFEEDSIKQSMAFLKQHMGQAIAREEERRIFFNEADPEASITGMHQAALLHSTSGDLDPNTIMEGLLKMDKKYIAGNEELILYMDVIQYRKLQQAGEIATVEKYGPKAAILTGEVSRVWGIPIAVTDQFVGNQAILMYRPAMVISQRRALTLRSFPIADDMTRIEATVRVNIGWPYGTGTDAKVAVRFAAS